MTDPSTGGRIRTAAGRGLSRVYETASHSSNVRLSEQVAAENRALSERLAQLESRLDAVLAELAAVREAQDASSAALAASVAENVELNRALIDSIAMLGHSLAAHRTAQR